MAYQSRKRHYKSRRERYLRDKRNFKLILIFAAIAGVVLMFKNREEILFYLKTIFY